MTTRMVIIPIEVITSLFFDYVGQVGFPDDAVPVKLMLNPQEQKLALVVESESFTGPQTPEQVKFDIRRIYTVGD